MNRCRVPALATVLLLTACNRPNPLLSGPGVVQAEITQVPPTITCVQLVASQGSRSSPSNFDVVPGQPATLVVPNLPVGSITFTAWAYAAACPAIGGKQATWASAPKSVNIVAGQVTPLVLTLEPVGGAAIGIDFGSDGGIDMTPPADMTTPVCACTGAQICCNDKCVDPTSDPKNCGACGVTCGSGHCGAVVGNAHDAWSFNGNASYDNTVPSFVLTPAAVGQVGTAIYKTPLIADEFDATFDFRITTPMTSPGAADGMGFMIEQDGPNVTGYGGGSFGMAKLTGFGVEFDTFNDANPADGTGGCGDTNGNHAAIDSLATCTDFHNNFAPTLIAGGTDLSLSTPSLHLADNGWHTATVSFHHGQMTVIIDALTRVVAPTLPGFAVGKPYYFGFGGGTGGSYSKHEVRNASITLPAAQCL